MTGETPPAVPKGSPETPERASPVTPEGASLPEPVPDSERRERLSFRIRAFQILLALGVLCAVVGAVISVSVAFALKPAVLDLPPVLHAVAVIAIARMWAWAVAPLAAWGAGRVLAIRPSVIAFSVCAWGEIVYVSFDLAVMGFGEGVYRSLGYFSGRVVTLALGMLFAWLLARHGRAVAERIKARHEAEAEATRQRYAKWLEEQQAGR